MKRFIIYGAIPLLAASCGGDGDFDATGTFEATEIVVSAEAAGRILRFDSEEGDVLRAGRQVGAIDTVQLSICRNCSWNVSALRCGAAVPTSGNRPRRCASRSPNSRPNAVAWRTC